MLKNVAGQSITSLILTASGTAVTAGTTTVRVTGDGGTQSGSGTATHEGNGQWSYAPSQAETNFNQIGFLFLNTGGVPVERTVFTDPINISSLNTQVSSLFTSVGSLHTRVSSVAVEVSSNAVGIGLIPVDASSTWTAIGSLSTRVSSVGVEVDSIQSYVAAILDDTGTSGVVIADKTGFSLAADQSGVTVGTINAIAGTINTLDALDTAQDTQHTITRTAISSLDVRVSSAAAEVGSNAVAIGLIPTDASSTWTALSSLDTRVSSAAVEVSSNATSISSLHTRVSSIQASSAPTAAQVADAVWDEAIAGHLGAGSTGEALNAAGASGDPWTTTLPGAYTGTQAGALLGSTMANSLYSRVSSMQAAIGAIPTDATSTWTAIASLDTRVSSIGVEVDSIQSYAAAILDDTGTSGVQVADKTGYSINGTITTLDALDTAQDVQHTATLAAVGSLDTRVTSAAVQIGSNATAISSLVIQVGSVDTRVSSITGVSSATITAAVWQANLSSFTTNNTTGKVLKGINEGWLSAEGAVDDAGATTTSFVTDLPSAVDDFYNGHVLVFIGGTLAGQSQIISDYNGTSKAVTLDHALTSAPANSDTFVILNGHQHTSAEIISMVNSAIIGTALAEPTSVPAANAPLSDKLSWVFAKSRNKMTQTGSLQTLYADNGTTVISSASVSDDGTTLTRDKDQ